MYTCSFHHGTECVPSHNRRETKAKSEAHIDEKGIHFSWIDEDITAAYERIFGEALQEYNEKQKRNDRKIKSYLKNVRENPKLNAVYECIIQVGNEDNYPDEELCREILKKYLDEFREKNKSLEVIGAYYHADELGAPHLHLDYIPVSEGKERGLKLKNNLTDALKVLGYETEFKDMLDENGKPKINQKTEKPYKTLYSAQMQFQEKERNRLKEICETYKLKIENPKRPPEEYSTSKQLREARNQRLENNAKSEKLEKLEKELLESEEKLKVEKNELLEKKEKLEITAEDLKEKENYFSDLDKITDKIREEVSSHQWPQKEKDFLPDLKEIKTFENPENLRENIKPGFGEKSHFYAYRVVEKIYGWVKNQFSVFQNNFNTLKTDLFDTKYALAKEKEKNQELTRKLNLYDYRNKTPEKLKEVIKEKEKKEQKQFLKKQKGDINYDRL